jgi:hypothetical protein
MGSLSSATNTDLAQPAMETKIDATDTISVECKNNPLLASYQQQIQEEKVIMQEALLKLAQHADHTLDPTILDIGTRGGNTDYIDFIRPHEMKSCIMYGTDYAHRQFVSFLLHFESIQNDEKSFDNVVTLFKRYTDAERWTYAISHGKPRIDVFETATDKMEFLTKIAILCSGRHVTITSGYDYRPEWNVTLQKAIAAISDK